MEMFLHRISDDGKSTQGKLIISAFKFDTLEPPYRDNHPWDGSFDTVSCVPQGRYQIAMNELQPGSHMYRLFAAEFPVLPLLVGVQNRSGIYLHPMNFVHDTHGCIGAGMMAGPDTILESRKAFTLLLPMLQKALQSADGIWLSVMNDFEDSAPAIPATGA